MTEASLESDWLVTANRYVACIDIMGFKDMVLRTPHNEIYNMMRKIDSQIKLSASIDWHDCNLCLIKTTNYSDSIMIYSKDDSKDSLLSFVYTVSSFTNDLLTEAIPHTGAVAYGMMTVDSTNSIYFGQPLIDAYLLQQELEFYGIVAHATVENEIENKLTDKYKGFVEAYTCNFKKGNSLHLTIYPMFLFVHSGDDSQDQQACAELFASCKKMRLRTSGHLRKYIDNTELYLNCLKKVLTKKYELTVGGNPAS